MELRELEGGVGIEGIGGKGLGKETGSQKDHIGLVLRNEKWISFGMD